MPSHSHCRPRFDYRVPTIHSNISRTRDFGMQMAITWHETLRESCTGLPPPVKMHQAEITVYTPHHALPWSALLALKWYVARTYERVHKPTGCTRSAFKRAFKCGFCSKLYTTEAIADDDDMYLFCKMANPRHCVHALLLLNLVITT